VRAAAVGLTLGVQLAHLASNTPQQRDGHQRSANAAADAAADGELLAAVAPAWSIISGRGQ